MSTEFVSQPFVCGVLGPGGDEEWLQMLAASPDGTQLLHRGSRSRFAATTRSRGLENTPKGWCWGRYIARSVRPMSIEAAADDLGLAGYWDYSDTASAVVHGDALGFQELYYRVLGDSIYFSSRIAPLAAVRPADPLHADWPAWARFFTFLGFTGSDTGFTEVRRLDRGHRLIATESGAKVVVVAPPSWLMSPSASQPIDLVADALVEAVREVIPSLSTTGVDVTLSGGHDSRLVLAAARRGGVRSIRANVTPHENGWGDDLRIAREVAGVSRIELREVDWTTRDWIDARSAVARRLEYQSALHNWFSPIARSLDGSRRPVLDGLAGDKLLHYHVRASASETADHRSDTLRRIGGWRISKEGILRKSAQDIFSDITADYWSARTEYWSGHPYREVLHWLEHRTSRVIAAAPFRVFGPERDVLTPLIDPAFVATVFDARPSSAEHPDIRQRLLRVLDPALATVETTSSLRSEGRTFSERGLRVREARLDLADVVGRLPFAHAVFRAETLESLTTGREMDADALVLLRAAAVLAGWYSEYGDRLTNPDPDWT